MLKVMTRLTLREAPMRANEINCETIQSCRGRRENRKTEEEIQGKYRQIIGTYRSTFIVFGLLFSIEKSFPKCRWHYSASWGTGQIQFRQIKVSRASMLLTF